MDPSRVVEINELDLERCHGVKLLAYGPTGVPQATVLGAIKLSIDVDGNRLSTYLGPKGATVLRDALNRWLGEGNGP